jgi:DNA-binding phage protein
MALTKDFRETVRASAQRDPVFRRALFCEALELLVNGEHELAKAVLRKFVNATVGFEELSVLVGIPSKSLHRMFGPRGNPSLGSLASVISTLRRTEKVHISVSLSKQTQLTTGVARLRALRKPLPKRFRFDRDEANAR